MAAPTEYKWTWPLGLDVQNAHGEWFVAQTKSRQEKTLAADLAAAEIPYFLPIEPHYTSRHLVEQPIFQGYVFVCGEPSNPETPDAMTDTQYRLMHPLYRRSSVFGIIRAKNQTGLKRDLAAILAKLRAGQVVDASDYLAVNELCNVIAGPWMGMEGKIEEDLGGEMAAVEIETMGRKLPVPIQRKYLERRTA